MHPELLERDPMTAKAQFSPAQVLMVSDDGKLKIRFPDDPAEREFWATAAMGYGQVAQSGQQVLIAGQDSQSLYAIGIISGPRNSALVEKRYLPGGGYAEISTANAQSYVRIFSPENNLILEYNSRTHQTRIHADAGGLELVAPDGDMVFRAGKQIRMEADSVAIHAGRAVDVGIIHALKGVLSQLRMRSDSAKLKSPEVNVTAENLNLAADRAAVKTSSLTGELENIKVTSHRAELITETLISRCKNVYQGVEELCQLCAGRLRTIVKSTWHSRSQNTYINTQEDFKVKADQIHLG